MILLVKFPIVVARNTKMRHSILLLAGGTSYINKRERYEKQGIIVWCSVKTVKICLHVEKMSVVVKYNVHVSALSYITCFGPDCSMYKV